MSESTEFTVDCIIHLLRVGVVLAISVGLASLLLRVTQAKPATRVLAWLLVLAPSWLLFSITLEIPWYSAETSPSGMADTVSRWFMETTRTTILEASTQSLNTTSTQASIKAGPASVLWPALLNSVPLILLTIWAAGIVGLLIRYLHGYVCLCKAVRQMPAAANLQWLRELKNTYKDSSLGHQPHLKISHGLGPLVCQIGTEHTVIVPADFWGNCTSDQRTAILHHELSHAERGDLWTLLLGRLLVLPQWFNPIAWLAFRRLNDSIEMACDDHVVEKHNTDRITYAKALLSLTEFDQSQAPTPALLAIGPPITQRIERIIHPKGIEMKFTLPLILASLTLLLLLTILRPELVAQQSQPAAPQSSTAAAQEPIDSQPGNQSDKVANKIHEAHVDIEAADLEVETYYVGDLVVPNTSSNALLTPDVYAAAKELALAQASGERGAAQVVTEKDFKRLKELLRSTISEDTWGSGRGTIEVSMPNLSLIINQTSESHQQIKDLLARLREIYQITIKLDAFVFVFDESKKLDSAIQTYQLPEDDFLQAYIAASKECVTSFNISSATVFNGQGFAIKPSTLALKTCQLDPIKLTAVMKADASGVHLSCCKLAENSNDKGRANAQLSDDGKLNKQTSSQYERVPGDVIATGHIDSHGYATIDITSLIKDNSQNQKAALMVRPIVFNQRPDR